MKRCPACQRTYAGDHLTFCLDDGSPLLMDESVQDDASPTVIMPQPRVTNPPQQPFPPAVNQASGAGFHFTNRVIGIIGASLVIFGVFMPLISFLGVIGVTYLQIAQMRAQFFTGYLVPVLGGLALLLALKNQFKPLIAIGIAVIAILILDYFRIKSEIANLPFNFPGARMGPATNPMAGDYLQSLLQVSWGFFVMVGGAVLLIVAGAKKDTHVVSSTTWNRPPPPPMNYS